MSIGRAFVAILLLVGNAATAFDANAASRGPADGDVSLHLGSAAREDLAALLGAQEWNRAGRVPLRAGFARTLSEPLALRFREDGAGKPALHAGFLSVSRTANAITARARIRVDDAWATRLHLDAGTPPPGSILRVFDGSGLLVAEIDLPTLAATTGGWLPPTRGEETRLEFVLPAGGAADVRLAVDRVTELFDAARAARPSVRVAPGDEEPPCLVDAMCVEDPALAAVRSSAALFYVDAGTDTYLCSGGLIRSSSTPDGVFFATATHCVAGTDLASMVIFWDFHSESCNAPPPENPFGPCASCPGGLFPKSFGATLLASNESVDFTLLAPGGPALAVRSRDGARRPPFAPTSASRDTGTRSHRFSHPLGLALKYSTHSFLSYAVPCQARGERFLRSRELTGHIEPGSSGSIAFGDDFAMTGTLFAVCYLSPDVADDDCRAPETYDMYDSNPFRALPGAYAPWLSDCAYPLSAEALEFDDAGGTRTFALDATAGCAWTAVSEASWAAVSPSSGSGGGTLTLSAPPNTTGRSRVGTLRAGFHLVRVAQYGTDCLAAVTPAVPPSFPPAGGAVTLRIEAPPGCAWQAGPLPDWLSVAPASGSGDGAVTVTVSRNAGRGMRSHALDLVHARTGAAETPGHTTIPVIQVRSTRSPLDAP